ncbi:hypothetical protein ATP98_27475 [Salmonella enterica]|nr:hypothetical protein [Salmonella enterica]
MLPRLSHIITQRKCHGLCCVFFPLELNILVKQRQHGGGVGCGDKFRVTFLNSMGQRHFFTAKRKWRYRDAIEQ